MRRYEPKTRYKISDKQEILLQCVLKYRFVSSDLLAAMLGRDRSTIYERLSVLVDQGYLIKLYNKSNRLKQKPVIYYLAPAGIRHLKHKGFDRTQLHYKNKYFTEEQIDEQLFLVKLAQAVRAPYIDHFALYTKYQLTQDELYLSPLPYAKLSGKTDLIPDYIIEYIPALYPSWLLRRRINQHLEFADEYEYTYPHLLLIAGNDSTHQRIVRMSEELYADFEVFTTTSERLLSGKKKIWLKPDDIYEDEEPVFHALTLTF